MNSSVTAERETSVISISCFEIKDSSRSKGPLKLASEIWNPVASVSSSPIGSGDRATRNQLSCELPIRLSGRVLRREARDGRTGDARVGELHRATDNGLEHLVAERLDNALENLARVERARVVHGR